MNVYLQKRGVGFRLYIVLHLINHCATKRLAEGGETMNVLMEKYRDLVRPHGGITSKEQEEGLLNKFKVNQ